MESVTIFRQVDKQTRRYKRAEGYFRTMLRLLWDVQLDLLTEPSKFLLLELREVPVLPILLERENHGRYSPESQVVREPPRVKNKSNRASVYQPTHFVFRNVNGLLARLR